MGYKDDKNKNMIISVRKKLEGIPPFIADFFDRYKSASTRNCYWGYIRDLLLWLIKYGYIKRGSINEIEESDMALVNDGQILKYLNELKEGVFVEKNSLETIGLKIRVYSTFWKYMEYRSIVEKNIISAIPKKAFRSERKSFDVKVPTKKQLEKLISNIEKDENNFTRIRNLAIVKLFLGSGIRLIELCNIEVKDLHLRGDHPYVYVLSKGHQEVKEKVFIAPNVVSYLKEYLQERKDFIKRIKPENKQLSLFLTEKGDAMSDKQVYYMIERKSQRQINPHMLRHYVGTEMYKKTKDILVVQQQLRHSSVNTTRRYYVQVDSKDMTNAVSMLDTI